MPMPGRPPHQKLLQEIHRSQFHSLHRGFDGPPSRLKSSLAMAIFLSREGYLVPRKFPAVLYDDYRKCGNGEKP